MALKQWAPHDDSKINTSKLPGRLQRDSGPDKEKKN